MHLCTEYINDGEMRSRVRKGTVVLQHPCPATWITASRSCSSTAALLDSDSFHGRYSAEKILTKELTPFIRIDHPLECILTNEFCVNGFNLKPEARRPLQGRSFYRKRHTVDATRAVTIFGFQRATVPHLLRTISPAREPIGFSCAIGQLISLHFGECH